MTHQSEKKCWYCGSTDMEKKQDFSQCRSCGATWNPIVKPSIDPITLLRDYAQAPKGKGSFKSTSPSGTIKRQSTKARSSK